MLALVSCILTATCSSKNGMQVEDGASADWIVSPSGYTLDGVVILSRHNIRSPLSGGGSVLGRITSHEWFNWTSAPGELSVRGGILETQMGQFYARWLDREGLISLNHIPEEGEVRIYANSVQRTIATAQFFSTGMLPLGNLQVEYHMPLGQMDPVFNPQVVSLDDAFLAEAQRQVAAMTETVSLSQAYALLERVLDIRESPAASGDTVAIPRDKPVVTYSLNSEPKLTGGLKMACSASDALILQYYEEPDPVRAAFGENLSFQDWETISSVKDTYEDILFTPSVVAAQLASPLLETLSGELQAPGRKFSFLCGHDSNICSVVSALDCEPFETDASIEGITPIGGKLMFCKWKSADGKTYVSIQMVYASTDQIRSMAVLSLDNPPFHTPVFLAGLTPNRDGLYSLEDVLSRFDNKQ